MTAGWPIRSIGFAQESPGDDEQHDLTDKRRFGGSGSVLGGASRRDENENSQTCQNQHFGAPARSRAASAGWKKRVLNNAHAVDRGRSE